MLSRNSETTIISCHNCHSRHADCPKAGLAGGKTRAAPPMALTRAALLNYIRSKIRKAQGMRGESRDDRSQSRRKGAVLGGESRELAAAHGAARQGVGPARQ